MVGILLPLKEEKKQKRGGNPNVSLENTPCLHPTRIWWAKVNADGETGQKNLSVDIPGCRAGSLCAVSAGFGCGMVKNQPGFGWRVSVQWRGGCLRS